MVGTEIETLPERPTARVLLLDPDGRILLMKGRLPSDPGGTPFWFTVGGGVDAGETILEAAAREILEETGFTDAELGPIAWYDETVLRDAEQRPWLFRQHYIVARTAGGALSRLGWQAQEHDLVDDLRWWTLAELRATQEMVYPAGLAELLPDILAGRIATPPLVIGTTEGVVSPLPRIG